MSAIITYFSAPGDYEELMDYFNEGGTNLDFLFSDCEAGFTNWSVSKDCIVGDMVFFCCAATSNF